MNKFDLQQIRKVFQEESKNFIVKSDLKSFATKDDLRNFATKDDLKILAGKLDSLVIRTINIEESLKNFITKDDFIIFKNEIMTNIDLLAKKVDDFNTEQAVNILAHNRFTSGINRLNRLHKLSPIKI